MIGRSSNALIAILFFSCANPDETECTDCELESDSVEMIEKVSELDEAKMEQFIDDGLVPEATIRTNSEQENEVIINGESYEILTYEGQLTDATIHSEGAELSFIPYDYYDEELEMLVESEYQFTLSLSLTTDERDYLDLTKPNPETNNILWDYFENLFLIYLYIDENQTYHPLKVINEGKTDWDG